MGRTLTTFPTNISTPQSKSHSQLINLIKVPLLTSYFDDLILKKISAWSHQGSGMCLSYILNQWNSITNIYFYWNYREQCLPPKKLNQELLQGVQGDGFRPEPSKLVKFYPKKQTLLPYLQRINVKIQVDWCTCLYVQKLKTIFFFMLHLTLSTSRVVTRFLNDR